MTAFLDPWADPYDSGFQLTQSLIAIGRGEWFGVGLGVERAEALLPARGAHRLRVRSAWRRNSASLGVIAGDRRCSSSLVVARAQISRRSAAARGLGSSPTSPSAIGIWLGLQAFVNVGVNMGLLPTKGLTLPLFSYGGSSMLVTLGWLGVLLRIHHETARVGPRRRCRARRGDNESACRIHHGGRHGRSRVSRRLRLRACCARRGFDVVWLGTQRGIEARLVPAEGIPSNGCRVGGLRGKSACHAPRGAIPARARSAAGIARAAPAPARGRARARAASRRARAASRHGCCGVRWWCMSRTRSRASPIACWRGSPTACSRVFPGSFGPRDPRRACRQSGPPRDRRGCLTRAAIRGARGPRTAARIRRQPGLRAR